MKKTIRMRMTNERFYACAGRYSRGDLAMGTAEIDTDLLSEAGKFIVNHITSTYILDEAADMIDVSAISDESMADRDRRNGKSENYIALMASGYGEAYTEEKLKIDTITFPIYGRQFKKPEEVIETTVNELIWAGAKKLISRKTGEEYDF